ncbi:MAG: hypothetical protein GX183_05825 [Firmicutes bacterium]|nr:hypothetical protein [Bacillota bacterium]
MYALLRKGYIKDVIALILATVVLGSAVAFMTAWATHGFFAGTARGILGDEDQHELVVHVRSDMRLEAKGALMALAQSTPGIRVSEGVTLLGRSNFMIDLEGADEAKFRWALDAVRDVPGYLGRTIVAEPRVTVTGLSGEAAEALQENIGRGESDESIRFVLRDGSNLHFVLRSADEVQTVSDEIEGKLQALHEVQVSAADGRQIDEGHVRQLVEAGAGRTTGGAQASDVRVWTAGARNGSGSDELPEAVALLRQAALSWAPSVRVRLDAGAKVTRGDRLVLRLGVRRADAQVVDADGVSATAVVISEPAVVFEALGGHAAGESVEGSAGQDAADGRSQPIVAYDAQGRPVGSADVMSAAAALERAAAGIQRSTAGVAETARAAVQQAQEIEQVLQSFEGAEQAVAGLRAALESARAGGRMPLSLDGVRLLLKLTDQCIGAIDRLSEVASGVSLLTRSYDRLIEDLAQWRGTLAGFRERLSAMESAAGRMAGGAGLIGDASDAAASMVEALQSMDLDAMGDLVAQAGQQLKTLADLDSEALRDALEQLRSSVPTLSGSQALAVVSAIDKLYSDSGGKDQARFIVEAGAASEELARAVKRELGDDYGVFVGPAGMVTRGVGAEVQSLLATVRATIAGIVCMVITAASLVVDHATVASGTLAMVRPGGHGLGSRRGRVARVEAAAYGAAAGSVTLMATAAISGARLGGLGLAWFLPVGAALGALAGGAADRLSPCNRDEVEAGVAWGIGPACVMREVVVPATRPGLLSLFNRGRTAFARKLRQAGALHRQGAGRKMRSASEGGITLCSGYRASP